MAATKVLPLLLLLLFATTAVSGSHSHAAGDAALGWIAGAAGSSECMGTIADCLAGGEEFDLGSESTRRILATSKYISYNALRRDSVPCSRRGASYYNCRPGAQANPYTTGCSVIAKCRS